MRHASALVSLGVLLVAPTVLAAPAVIRDRTFADGNWSVTPFAIGDGGLVEATQTTDGTPAPSRRVRVVVDAAPSPTEFSAINGVSLFAGMLYDPQTQGAFVNVDYFEDALLVQGFGDGQATGVALRQGGNVYIRQVGSTPDFAWTRKQDLGVPSSAFVRIFDGGFDPGSHPDFSASGGPIEFGFMRSNSTSLGAIGYEIVALIDNWTVLINTPCALDADCIYPDGCFTGTCVAGVCQATAMVCDDGNPCTDDECVDGVCQATPIVCDDGDPCTTDACDAGSCTAVTIDCDDDLPCTVDFCSGGTCSNVISFETVEAAIDALLALLATPPCAGDGIAARPRQRFTKKLMKARNKLVLADAATKERLLVKLVGSADHLLERAAKLIEKGASKGSITPECAATLQSYLTSVATCTDGLAPTL